MLSAEACQALSTERVQFSGIEQNQAWGVYRFRANDEEFCLVVYCSPQSNSDDSRSSTGSSAATVSDDASHSEPPLVFTREKEAYHRINADRSLEGRVTRCCPTIDLGAEDEHALLFEFIDCPTLSTAAATLSLRDVYIITNVLEETLHRLHRAGVSHNKVVGSNILLRPASTDVPFSGPVLSNGAQPILRNFSEALTRTQNESPEEEEAWNRPIAADFGQLAFSINQVLQDVSTRDAMTTIHAAPTCPDPDATSLASLLDSSDPYNDALLNLIVTTPKLPACITLVLARFLNKLDAPIAVNVLMLGFWSDDRLGAHNPGLGMQLLLDKQWALAEWSAGNFLSALHRYRRCAGWSAAHFGQRGRLSDFFRREYGFGIWALIDRLHDALEQVWGNGAPMDVRVVSTSDEGEGMTVLETRKLIQQLEEDLGEWLRGAYRAADPVVREGEKLRAAVLMLRRSRMVSSWAIGLSKELMSDRCGIHRRTHWV